MSQRQAAITRLLDRSTHRGELGNHADRSLLEHADRRSDLRFRYAALVVSWLMVVGLALTMCGCSRMGNIARPGDARADDGRASSAIKLEVLCISGDPTSGGFSGKMALGSGVIVSPLHALTALHVVKCESGTPPIIHVVVPDGSKMLAMVDKVDEDGDIARVKLVDGMFASGDVPRVDRALTGHRVCSASAAPDRAEICGTVVVSTTVVHNGGIWHTAHSISGNSGSGLYDSSGALVGIVVMRVRCPNGDADSSCGGRATSLADRLEMFP